MSSSHNLGLGQVLKIFLASSLWVANFRFRISYVIFFSKKTFLKFPTIQVILSLQKFLGLNFWVFGYSTHHYFQHLHLPKLYFTMDYVVFICNVLYFQCISMDSIGYYYKYFGKILPSWNHLCFMDFNDLYGNLYTIDISSNLVFTEKSKYNWNLRGQWFE